MRSLSRASSMFDLTGLIAIRILWLCADNSRPRFPAAINRWCQSGFFAANSVARIRKESKVWLSSCLSASTSALFNSIGASVQLRLVRQPDDAEDYPGGISEEAYARFFRLLREKTQLLWPALWSSAGANESPHRTNERVKMWCARCVDTFVFFGLKRTLASAIGTFTVHVSIISAYLYFPKRRKLARSSKMQPRPMTPGIGQRGST